MFIRVLVSEPPLWQVALSIALAALTVVFLLWATSKIFRVGSSPTASAPPSPSSGAG